MKLMLLGGILYITWCLVLYFNQGRMLFPRDLAGAPQPKPFPGVVALARSVPGLGEVEAWLVPAPEASPERPAPAVIFFHGNAEILDDLWATSRFYHRMGVTVLMPEYRGYRRSAGKPSEKGIVEDAVYFHDLLAQRPDVDAKRIFLHGHSLGGGVAAQLAAQRPPAALILESTFTSIADMARGYWAPGFLVKHSFHTNRVLPQLRAPTLILHGTNDTLVPVSHGRQLHVLAPNSVLVEFPCGHNDMPGQGGEDRYEASIRTFLATAGVLQTNAK